jgi:acetoin utilization protein AcuC
MLDNELANYHFGQDHPFGPKRYWAFKEAFEKRNFSHFVQLSTAQLAADNQLLLFHTEAYVNRVKQLSISGDGYLDCGDTPAHKGIYDAASIVVGTTLKAIDLIMTNQCQQAFTPIAGLHHAMRNCASGFCVFNDCAIAIEYLRKQYSINRIAYIDIDAHHGDGVFYSFEEDANLCIVDFHQDGRTLYPGSGFIHETGKGEAKGSKLNIPLAPFTTDDIAEKFWQSAENFIDKFQPEFILLQCGADSIQDDPITQLNLTSKFHAHVTERLVSLANIHAHGRLLAMGGGGYNLHNIQLAWNDVIQAMMNESL